MFFTVPFTVYTYLSDRNCKLSLQGMAQLFQEAAEMHCMHLGVGTEQLASRGKAWVLSRICYRVVRRFPNIEEPVIYRTWSRGTDGLMAFRECEILDAENNVLVACTSNWVIIDFNTRKVCRIGGEMDNYENHDRKSVDVVPEKLLMPADMVSVLSFNAPYSSIDKNQHVNNAEYLRWISDVLPDDLHKRITGLDINYNLETQPNEEVNIKEQIVNQTVWIQISNPRGIAVNAKVLLN